MAVCGQERAFRSATESPRSGHAVYGLRGVALAAFAALVLHTMQPQGRDHGDADEEDSKFETLCDLFAERVSHLKALHAASQEFCARLRISAGDVDKMTGLPFPGSRGALDLIEEVVGEIAPDEVYRQRCRDHMTGLWKTTIRERYPE